MAEQYADHRPTCFDRHIALEDRETWLVAPVTQTRDSGPSERSNFTAALKMLGGESDSVEVHRFGHWGPGWYEIIIVDPTNADAAAQLYDIERSLADYPLLDEDAASEAAYEEFVESWQSWGWHDLRDLIKKEFDLSDNTADRMDDVDPSDMQEWWHQTACEEYFEESSGIAIPIRSHVERMDRNDCARLLWKVRQITNQANLTR